MPRKAKSTKTAKPEQKTKQLSLAELFYIEQHAGKKTAEEIGSDLQLTLETVAEVIKGLPAKPVTKFLESQGTVAMSESQSIRDDENRKNRPKVKADLRNNPDVFVHPN